MATIWTKPWKKNKKTLRNEKPDEGCLKAVWNWAEGAKDGAAGVLISNWEQVWAEQRAKTAPEKQLQIQKVQGETKWDQQNHAEHNRVNSLATQTHGVYGEVVCKILFRQKYS